MDYSFFNGHNNYGTPSGAGNALKSCRQEASPIGSGCNTALHPRWDLCDNRHGLDAFGFSALPGGQRYSDGAFLSVGRFGLFWSSAFDANFEAWFLYLSKFEGQAHFFQMDAGRRGASVRCIRD